jgi:hypothetical protein
MGIYPDDKGISPPPLPPPLWQWLCIVVIVGWIVAVWLLWR